jgi:hypothetical protein
MDSRLDREPSGPFASSPPFARLPGHETAASDDRQLND